MDQALSLFAGQDITMSGRSGTIKHVDNDVVFIKFDDNSHYHFANHEVVKAADEGDFQLVAKQIDIRCAANITEAQQLECERRSAYCQAFLAFKEAHPTLGVTQILIDEVFAEIGGKHPKVPAMKTVYAWYKLWLSDGQDMALQVVNISEQDQRMDDEVKVLMHQIVKKRYLQKNRPTITSAYGFFIRAFRAQKKNFIGIDLPSKSTFERFINRLPKHVVNLERFGKRYADKESSSATSEYSIEIPLELVQGDGVEINMGLLNEDGSYAGKVSIFATIDVATRSCLGYAVQVDKKPKESAAAVIHSLSHSIRIKTDPEKYPMGGLAMTYVLDNGPGYRAEMTRKFIHALGSDITYCRSRRADEKPHVERMFGTWRTKFFKTLPGYLGKREKGVVTDQTIKQAATLTIAEFMVLFEAYVQDEYHHTPNKGINNWTPYEMWKKHACADEVMTLRDFDDRLKLRGNAKHLQCNIKSGIIHRAQRFNSDKLQKALVKIIKNSGKKSEHLDVLIDDFDASAITVVLPDLQMINVPNVAGVEQDTSFTLLKSLMRNVNESDAPVPLSAQKAKNIVKKKRANGTLVDSDTLINDDEITNNPTPKMERDIAEYSTITDKERATTTGFNVDE